MRLAVATTNTGAVFSCSQVSSVPKTRAVTPLSVVPEEPMPERPFSISSIQSTTGATLSATRMALRRFSSEEPDQAGEDAPDVEAQERQPPLGGDRLGGEALAAALHAQEQQALRLGQPELARRLAERGARGWLSQRLRLSRPPIPAQALLRPGSTRAARSCG